MHLVTRAILALVGVLATALVAAGAALAAGWYFLAPGLPSVETIRDVPLQVPLRIYSRDGRLIAQLGEYRRKPVEYADVPPVLVQAFLAAEDDRFFEHPGFDYQGILRAGINLVLTGARTQGGSTITQQLARAYFLSSERTFLRKAREILLAMRIEQAFTKEEILTLYLNKIFLGQRAYGVAAAAEVYFGKPLSELTVAEAATIAGIPKAPSVLNPVADPVQAKDRRAYVLRRMRELDYISEEAYQEALATPMESRVHGPGVELEAPYIAEMVRAEMVARYGPDAYTDGYRVTTTVDSRLQEAADRALRTALLEYDRRHGYRGPVAQDAFSQLEPGLEEEKAWKRLLNRFPQHADLYPALVLSLGADNSADLYVQDVGRLTLSWDSLRRRRHVDENTVGPPPARASEVVSPGDVIYVLRTANRGWLLGQLPVVQGALVALDPRDGATVALAGGYDFFASKFNRAIQARRQPGSSFKPFVYSAALENGYTAATLVNDAPILFGDGASEWRPENNTRAFYGPTRLREGLVQSLNLVTIRVLLDVGVNRAIEHIRAFGLPESAMPPNPTMALGSGGVTPREMAAGYATFANGGFRVTPYLIERIEGPGGQAVFLAQPAMACPECPADGLPEESLDGTVDLQPVGAGEEVGQTAPRAIPPENAYIMYDMMRDVIRRGTGRRALALGRDDLAGKTGTSNDRRDAWFSGFNGNLVATAWVGFDQERSLGNREEGSRTALPMWIYFMAEALKGQPSAPLPRPPGIIMARISPETGQFSPFGVFELFRESDLARIAAQSRATGGPAGSASPGADADEIF
jgi:penicillin-binding protein 1A